jgi:hypothetical protein
MHKVSVAFVAAAISAALPTMTLAGVTPAPTPLPLAGAGLPALAIACGAIWLIHKFRQNRRAPTIEGAGSPPRSSLTSA